MAAFLKFPRGTRSGLNTLKSGSALVPNSLYWLTDEARLVYATTTTVTIDIPAGTLGTGAFKNIAVGTSAPGSPAAGDLWVDTN